MAINKEKVKELLGHGLSNEAVGAAVGCGGDYIHQLMSDENFREEVVALRVSAATEHSARDGQINKLEDKLIEKLDGIIDYISKPSDILRAFQVLNTAKRRGVMATGGDLTSKEVVQLTIPVYIQQKITVNKQNEVIEAAGQTLVTMSTHQLLSGLASKGGDNGDKYKDITRFLPAGARPVKEADGG